MFHLKTIVMVVCIVNLVVALPARKTNKRKGQGSNKAAQGKSDNCPRKAEIGNDCTKSSGDQGVCMPPGNCQGNCRLKCVNAPPQCSDDTLPDNPNSGTWVSADDGDIHTLACLECEEGYYVYGGPGCVQCQLNGTWSSSTAYCEPINCGASSCTDYLLVLDVDGESFVGSTASVSCLDGFTPGYNNVECLTNGTWDIPDNACSVPPPTTTMMPYVF